jgi:hypothetical protein
MWLRQKVDHYKPSSSVTSGTLQYKSPSPTLYRKDVKCYIQPAGFKDRTTLMGHIAEEPYAIFLRYRPDHDFAQGDELWETIKGVTTKYQVIVPPRDSARRGDHLKCICKRVKT